jgi:hypothetical protein
MKHRPADKIIKTVFGSLPSTTLFTDFVDFAEIRRTAYDLIGENSRFPVNDFLDEELDEVI